MQRVRDAIDYLAATYRSNHPLLGHEFFTDGKTIFVKKIEQTVDIGRKGQLAFRELIDAHLNRIVTDQHGFPERVFPIRHHDITRRPIVIVPDVCSGQPITPRKGIRVSVLVGRRQAGESYQNIAEDYGLSESEVEDAIEYMEAA